MTRTTAPAIATALLGAVLAAGAAADELAIGAKGPAFNLKGTDGRMYSLDGVKGEKGTAVIFTCNECPYAKGYEDRLIELAQAYQPQGIAFVAINPNDPKVSPGDGFDFMVKRAQEKGFPYPYVFDDTQGVAAAYGAKVTPHIFLLNASGTLVYRGRIDDNLKEEEVKKRDFQSALDALLAGGPVKVTETKAFGCGVKWSRTKKG
jgi:thiol-disulfide isomerase/thioredoxin